VSDLHLEYNFLTNTIIKNIYSNKIHPTKYIALIGDIGNYNNNNNLNNFIKYCSQNYDKVLYVPGNHEYWSNDKYTMAEIKIKLNEICNKHNVTLLDNNICYINNTKFIGSTLWSYVGNTHKQKIQTYFGNFKNIYKNKSTLLTIDDTNNFNKDAIKFIQNELNNTDLIPNNKQCILLTHYAPIYCNPNLNQYTSNPIFYEKYAYDVYHSNIEYLIKKPITTCLYGHTHYCSKFYRNNILYCSNQLGKNDPNFDLSSHIEIDHI